MKLPFRKNDRRHNTGESKKVLLYQKGVNQKSIQKKIK